MRYGILRQAVFAGVAAVILGLAAPGPGLGQAPRGNLQMAAQITEARKANAALMRQYTWNSRTEVIEGGETKDTRIELVNYGPDGTLVRSILNDQSAPLPRGFLRHAAAEEQKKKMEEYLTGLRGLLDQYTLPTEGKILDFLNQATTSGPDAGGLVEMTGRNVAAPGDTFSVWADARTRRTQKVQVTTFFQGDMVNVVATFQTLSSGLTYMAYAEVTVAAKQLKVLTQNFNYTGSNVPIARAPTGAASAQVPPGPPPPTAATTPGGAPSTPGPPGAPPPAATTAPRLSAAELEKLVGPIALYPDALVAIVLPSATTPIEIVKAQHFLEKLKKEPKLKPDPSLPEPVRNLLNYPDVINMMSNDIDWTEKLGQAVVAQQKDVMQAIQSFRRKAQAAGNLKSNDKQIVVVEKEVIQIIPANPQVIYVPQYQPSTVVVYQSAPAVVYYPTPYPVYYYPYPPGTTFATGFFFGAATAYGVGWANNSVYHGMRYDDVEQLQQNRMNYASQSREDWQSWSSQQQSQRQQAAQDRQTQRQDSVSGAQDQRAQTQSQRQESASQAQSQRSQTQSQQQQGAGQAQTQQMQAQRQGGQASGQSWQPSQRSGQAQASAQSAQFGGRQSGGEGGAFGGRSSGAETSQMSQRGAQSRSEMSGAGGGSRSGGFSGGGARSGGSSGGGRSGGGGRRR